MNRTVRHIGLVLIAVACLGWSCTPIMLLQTTSTSVHYSHKDDASKYRPQVEASVRSEAQMKQLSKMRQ